MEIWGRGVGRPPKIKGPPRRAPPPNHQKIKYMEGPPFKKETTYYKI